MIERFGVELESILVLRRLVREEAMVVLANYPCRNVALLEFPLEILNRDRHGSYGGCYKGSILSNLKQGQTQNFVESQREFSYFPLSI